MWMPALTPEHAQKVNESQTLVKRRFVRRLNFAQKFGIKTEKSCMLMHIEFRTHLQL